MSQQELKRREEVDPEDTWGLEWLYPGENAWLHHYRAIEIGLSTIAGFKGRLDKADSVLMCLEAVSDLSRLYEKVHQYAHLRNAEDVTSAVANERLGKIENLGTQLGKTLAFIDPDLLQQPDRFLRSLTGDKRFKNHKFYLKKLLRAKKHVLSLPEEELLASLGEILRVPENIFGKFSDGDLRFSSVISGGKELPLTHGSYGRLIESRDREVRKQAAENMNGKYGEFRHTCAEALFRHIKGNVILARVRKYRGVIDSFLYDKAIPPGVYLNLFRVMEESLPSLHRYADLRKRLLGLDELHWYDLYVPLVGKDEPEYPYAEAVKTVLAAVEPLGPEYVRVLARGLSEERWVDKFENKGKRSGAFSSRGYDSRPFILMNYNGTLNSVYTLAHEAGHSLHSHFASRTQSYENYHYNIFLAEIASTTNEMLLSRHLLRGARKDLKRAIINRQLESIRTTFFRQTLFAMFEEAIYNRVDKDEVLTPDFLDKEYLRLNRKIYGPGVVVDDFIRHEWSRIPHLYYDFYVYQYATGVACAHHFSESILSGGPKERDNYLKFLGAGGSDYAVSTLKRAGLDVTSPDYLRSLMKYFNDLLDEFERLTN